MRRDVLELLTRIANALALQFGSNCEVVIHDLTGNDPENTIACIENGHVSRRDAKAGPSHIVLDAMREGRRDLPDHYNYLTKTNDGRILRSSSVYIKDETGKATGIFCINYDLTEAMMAQSVINNIVQTGGPGSEPEHIPTNVNELLDDLLEKSVQLVGKPVAMMNKDDKVRAIAFLNDAGALLITKSGDKIAKYFGISKYTLYSYLDCGADAGK
ncbi:MAG: transcriptional regulator [Clostridia bacterium]|nr:helix-turn-helix transcriptional regulator [Candidatus Pelethousia sp.]NCB31186.1 transcriptional regulator [Clostridia bacterium]